MKKTPQFSRQKYKGKIDPTRSRSAPSILKSVYIKPSNSKVLSRKPCSEIEQPCQFYIAEIQKRRFISPSIRNSLIDQIKFIINIGTKIVQTNTKDVSISKQFWKVWSGFQNTLVQEFNHQIMSTKSSIKKLLTSLKDYIKFVGDKSKQEEVTQLVNQTIDELNQDSDENFANILSEFKDLQAYVSNGDINSKQRNVNFQLTSLLSPILTQLQNLKDIKSSSDKFFSHIDNDTQTFQSLIHNDDATSPSRPNIRRQPLTKKSQPAFHKSNYDHINKINDSSSTYLDSEDQLSIEISNAKEENEKLKKQIEEMQRKKSDKRIELEDKRKEEINEIKNLKSTISTLKQKSKQLSSQNTNRNTKSSQMYVPLNPLRSEIRELELEQVKLDAANDFLIESISNSNSKQHSLSNYRKHSELAKQNSELNKEFFQLRIKCIQINKVIQKATAKTYETYGNDKQIRKDLANAQKANEDLRLKLEKTLFDFNEQKIQHEEELVNKIKSELLEEGLNQNRNDEELNDSNSFDETDNNQKKTDKSANLQQQLNNVKRLYRNKKQNLIEEEQKKQIKSARKLRKKTENDLTLLRCNLKSDFDDMMAQAQEVNKQYVDITNQYNEAQKSNKTKINCYGQTLSKEEAEKEIEKLISKFTNLNIRINKSNAEEANKENVIMKNEISEIANGNMKLINNLRDVKNKSVKMHSKIQSLHLQHQIFEKKNQNLQYDVNDAFSEAIDETNQQNLVLQDMLNNSIEDLKEMNIEVPF